MLTSFFGLQIRKTLSSRLRRPHLELGRAGIEKKHVLSALSPKTKKKANRPTKTMPTNQKRSQQARRDANSILKSEKAPSAIFFLEPKFFLLLAYRQQTLSVLSAYGAAICFQYLLSSANGRS